MSSALLGQSLRTTTNEYVTIEGVEGEYIFVCYRNKLYRRHKSIIGVKLFVCESKEYANEMPDDKAYVSDKNIDNDRIVIIECCDNCMEMRSGECAGSQGMCEFYRYCPSPLSKEQTADWPKYGDATYFRMKYGKK